MVKLLATDLIQSIVRSIGRGVEQPGFKSGPRNQFLIILISSLDTLSGVFLFLAFYTVLGTPLSASAYLRLPHNCFALVGCLVLVY